MNAVYFNAVTRALNSTMYWTMQIVGSLAIGLLLDYTGWSRRKRGFVGLIVMALITTGVWIGGFIFQLGFDASYDQPKHWTDPGFGGPFFLYMMYGLTDAIYQSFLYWTMGAMSNDTSILARYAGFYKALQSAGSAFAFGIDTGKVELRWACLIPWILLMVSFPFIGLVVSKIPDTNVTADEIAEAAAEKDPDIKHELETA